MYQIQKQKGITLIALVITIIVLIILAGVAINLSLGENGILRRTENARKESEEATVRENIENAVLQVQIEEVAQTGRSTLQKLYETLGSKDSNITLNEYVEGDEQLTGTYTLEGKTYSFTINEKFEVVVGEEAETKPVQFGEMVWNADGTVSLTLSSKISDSIEYQVNGTDGTWISGSQVTGLQPGDKVYVRINDGNTVTEAQEIEIKDEIAPEEFEISVPEDGITYEAIKLSTTGTTDNQTGLATYSYVAATNGTAVKEITNQTVTEYTIEGLSPETEYVVYMLAYDNAGNVRKSNEVAVTTLAMPVAKMFGQYVDYPVDIDDNPDDYDWQIFYKEDDETSPNYGATYIIADDYVKADKIANSLSNTGMKLYYTSDEYQVCWATAPGYNPITETVKRIFMYDYEGTSNKNVQYTSRLLDVTAWENDLLTQQLKTTGGLATGGPTINMWCASWNKAYPTEIITPTISGDGYLVNNQERLELSTSSDLYFNNITEASGGTLNYWIASPSSARYNYLINISKDRAISNRTDGMATSGLRPLIYLPPSVTLTQDAETPNLWNINY